MPKRYINFASNTDIEIVINDVKALFNLNQLELGSLYL